MKTSKYYITALFVSFLILSFTFADFTYKADVSKSKIVWLGKKVTGEHTGNITLKSGSLVTDGKSVKSGIFVIDMNSMTCTDLKDADYNGKLIGHLKNDDFFGTDKFPTSTLEIISTTVKSANQIDCKGKLTIKGISQEISFPAKIKMNKTSIVADAILTIDRTKFDVKYGSSSFFDNLGDKAISNDFTLTVSLVTTK